MSRAGGRSTSTGADVCARGSAVAFNDMPTSTEPYRPLFQRFPRLREVVPWLPVCDLPTPIVKVGLTSPTTAEIWVKRDDLTATEYGGNKVRALEFSLAEALHLHCREAVTCGILGSNWLLASAFYARRFGLQCQAHTFRRYLDPSRRLNASLLALLADKVVHHRNLPAFLVGLVRERMRKDPVLYFFPPGGTSATTCLGYVNAMLELAEQVSAGLLPRPTVMFVPLGSGGTCAGLLVGLEILGWSTKLVGVRVADRIVSNRFTVALLAKGCYTRLQQADPALRSHVRLLRRFEVDPAWIGPGYGHPTAEARHAVERFRKLGLQLDTTYTGKTMACLLERVARGRLQRATVLFWHTLNSRPLERLAMLVQAHVQKPAGG